MDVKTSPAGLGPADRGVVTRRTVVRRVVGVTLAAAVVPAAALVGRAVREPRDDMKNAAGEDFEVTYRGRRIRGTRGNTTMREHAAVPWDVTIDGRPLNLMRRADGSYLSMVNHYQSFPTPLAAARGAVDELGDQVLRRHAL